MVMSNAPGRMRSQGVVPTSGEPNSAPPRTVTHCVPAQMFAIEMGDESGKKVTTIIFRVGDVLYSDPNGEQWASNLRTISKNSWLYKQLIEATDATEKVAEVPNEDAVDVTRRPSR
jgi:hypothetical protein